MKSVCHTSDTNTRVRGCVRVRTDCISTLTMRLPSTASSVLSRRSGPLSAALMGKMLPEDLGRLFRPCGAEHMHAQPASGAQAEADEPSPEPSPRARCCSNRAEAACSGPDGAPAAACAPGLTFSAPCRQQGVHRQTGRGGATLHTRTGWTQDTHTEPRRRLRHFHRRVTSPS